MLAFGLLRSVYTMLGFPSYDVGCMVKPYHHSCILDLLVDDIWRDFYRWLLELALGARCAALDEVVILCDIDIFYMTCVLKWMVVCMRVGSTLEGGYTLGGKVLSSRCVGTT